MRTLVTAVAVGVLLATAGCSKPTQDKTAQDLKAVGSEVGSAARQVGETPAAKQLGSDIKQGAQEAGEKTKQAASQAGEKLQQGANQAGADIQQGAHKAGQDLKSSANQAKDEARK